MNWIWLCIAGILEIFWAVGMKYSHGFTRLIPSLLTVAAMLASLGCLALAMRTLPLGTAYAVWTGIGTVGTVIVGMIFFGESTAILRILCLLLIVSGIVGLKLLSVK
ncbi:quaternary ammonium compound efflux SMR transporter SugE [uncultured Victivallis sp.]|uniref:quaternary ammonium compound efflux SMR transporter SugE n=1 Tax=uncultured Victivallis sp. TaxID=354118 RepID=UPI0025D1C743|nr:quaternary ammonium compound efflux SMR transporter SugE [uncultured Victivallis sp.]